MRTRTCLGSIVALLALAMAGVAGAQIKAELKTGAAVKPEAQKPKADKGRAEETPPAPVAAPAPAPAPAQPAAVQGAAAMSPAPQTQAQPAPALAADSQVQQPVGQTGQVAPQSGGPTAPGEPRFYQVHKQEPRRFLQRSDQRYFPGEVPGARPQGPAPVAPPEPPRVRGDAGAAFGLGLAVDLDWNLDEGYDLYGEDDVAPRLGLWFSYDLLQLGKRAILAAEIGASSGMDSTNWPFGDLDTSLNVTRFHLAADLRYALWPVLQPYLRLAAHGSLVKMELNFPDDESFTDKDFSGGGSLGVGFTVRTPTRLFENRQGKFASLSVGVLFEGGYMLASPVSFDLGGKGSDDRIEVTSASLGELDLSGPYFRTSLVVRF